MSVRGNPAAAAAGAGDEEEETAHELLARVSGMAPSVAATLAEAAELAAWPPGAGKLQMQSAIDALGARLDVNFWDCALLVRTGVLSDASAAPATAMASAEAHADVRELLARLQIGQSEAKGQAVDGLLEALNRDEKSVLSVLGCASVAALVQLLTAPAPAVREKAAMVACVF